MNNQDSDINIYGSCLSREEMVQYLNGKLSDSEQHRIENHLLECELCEDAMTGLEGMADKSQITAIDDQLHTEIDVLLRGEKEEKVKVLFPWRMAAAFALLVVSTAVLFLILPKKDEMELFTQEFKPYPAPLDSVVLQTPGNCPF
jgi:predicted anti-sigma-YlaC factor YlaD